MAITLRLNDEENEALELIGKQKKIKTQSGTIKKLINEYENREKYIDKLEAEVKELKGMLDGLNQAAESFKKVLGHLEQRSLDFEQPRSQRPKAKIKQKG